MKYILNNKYVLIYENLFKQWKLVKIKERKSILIQSITWVPVEIKDINLIKPNHIAIKIGKELKVGPFEILKSILKEIVQSRHKKK